VQALFVQERADEIARLKTAVAPDIEDFLFGTPPAASSTGETAKPVRPATQQFVPRQWGRRAAVTGLASAAIVALAVWAGAKLLESPLPPAAPPVPLASPTAVSAVVPVPTPAPAAVQPRAAELELVTVPKAKVVTRHHAAVERSKPVAAGAPVERAAGPGRLTFDTVPWTEVFLDGKKLGVTPLVELALPAGRHTLRLVNAEKQIDRGYEVTISTDETLTVPRVRL
jgi:serine/threonine-protein kinase